MFATVVTSSKQAGIGSGLTYAVPADMEVAVGQLVTVPLRRKLVEGMLVELSNQKPDGDFDLREVSSILDETPLLSASQIALAQWMADYYVCSLRHALSVFLPGSEWSKLLPEKKEFVRLLERPDKKLGKKQEVLIDLLEGKEWVEWDSLKGEASRDVLKRLVQRDLVEIKEEHACRGVARYAPTGACDVLLPTDITLTPRQTAAYKVIKSSEKPSLLFGVTGSGKTEVYAALIRDTIHEGKSAILLLPEILLTENFIHRFEQLVERSAISVVHSRLTPAQRRNEWRKIRSGDVRLVIGSRSALFSPVQNLGLIIIDEEHEWTYKNEQTPRYHAGRVAEEIACHAEPRRSMARGVTLRRAQGDTPTLVLGTATPSVETWHKAKTGEYQLIELPERYGSAELPSVRVVDLVQVQFGKHYPFSPALLEAIRKRLENHEQVVLFLNRRGFATNLLCLECRERFEDPQTHLPYTVHYRGPTPYLLSHHTGEELPIPSACPHCGSANLRPVGAGTQKVEALLEDLFPSARLLRADADTLKHPEQMRLLLKKMKEGHADILLGTQSVVKGLDLPGVTLAAVLLADIGLSLPHFRAGERVFQLLTQLTGRSGRRVPGEVIIQTFRPDAVEVELAAKHDVQSYLERELGQRREAHYPPDTQLVRIVFSGDDAAQRSKKLADHLSLEACPEPGRRAERLQISRSPSLFSGGRVWHVFLRGENVREALQAMQDIDGVVDIDPVECL